MLFREKLKLAASGKLSGSANFSALRSAWQRAFSANPAQTNRNAVSLAQDFGTVDCSPELHGLIGTLKFIRRRVLTNTFLNGTAVWLSWILIGLIVVGVLSAKLVGWLFAAAFFAVIGVVAIVVWRVHTRLSIYQTACHLDSATSLQDRASTAIYFGDVKNPGGMIERQRGDAVTRVAKMDPTNLFPIRFPVLGRRVLFLGLIFAGLFIYRIHHKPPLVALLQTTGRSSLVQSVFSPLVHAMERDLERTMALVGVKPEAAADEVRAGDSMPSEENLWPSGDETSAEKKEGQQVSLEAADGESPDEMQGPGDQNGMPPDSQEQANGQLQEGKNGNDNNGSSPADGKASPQKDGQSLGRYLMEAMKNMMSSPPDQQSKNRGDRKSPSQDAQGAPQSGNSRQPGTADSDKNQQSRGSSDSQQKQSKTSSSGAGSQQGSKEFQKNQSETHSANAVPDRVALESSGFKEQTRTRIETDTGTARLGLRDGSSQAEAVINGAEQENIPARYRLYVQHYFEHADNGKQ